MAADLVLAPEAEQDIAEAYAWYEARGVGLGERFLAALDARIALIHRQPLLFAQVHEEYRRALLRRFPYAVFFDCSEARVTVYAVFHTSRDPGKWRERLPSTR